VCIVCTCLGTADAPASRPAEKPHRGVIAVRNADGAVYVGWRLLADEPQDVAFHVYRMVPPERKLEQLTSQPIRDCTNYVDRSVAGDPQTRPAHYLIKAVTGTRAGELSEAAPVTDAPPGGSYLRIRLEGDYAPQKVAIGDLDGDGRYDYVIKQPNFNVDPYEAPGYWKKSQDTYKIEAWRSDGKLLWRHDMGWSIEEGIWYSPYVVYDLDGDGRAEVYTKAGEGDPRDPDGRVTSGPEWLIRIDGSTGRITARLPWPDRTGFEKYNYYSRNLLGIAYLDGRRPHLIVERGTYGLIKVVAYDPELRPVWQWQSTAERERYSGQGMHGMHAADVDADGRDEIVYGAAVLDDNGHGLWTLGTGHPDVCYVGEIDPTRPGLEIFFGIEPRQRSGGVRLVEARTGRTLWQFDGPTRHVHGQGMVADILSEHPGQECYAGEKDGSQYWLYTALGRRIGDTDIGGLVPRAAWWDKDPQKEIVRNGLIGDFGGKTYGRIEGTITTIADFLGDWREEIITSLPGEIRIYCTTIPATARRPWLMQDRLYRTDVAAASMGYFYPPQLGTALFPQGQ